MAENCPGVQNVLQLVEEFDPVDKVVCPAAQAVHAVVMVLLWYVPTAQAVHGIMPLAEYVPAAQGTLQAELDVAPVDSVVIPAPQVKQKVWLEEFWY